MAEQNIKIKTDDENPIDVEIIAEAIIKISDAFEQMKKSRLTERAILVLIRDRISGNIGLGDIKTVLDVAANLKDHYIKPKK